MVRVSSPGATLRERGAGGIQIELLGGDSVLYGHATWIDGSGKKTEVQAVPIDGTIVMRVPASVLDESTYPAVLDPIITPAIWLEPRVPTAQFIPHNEPGLERIACGDSSCLLIFGALTTVLGVRVTPSGQVLDEVPIQLGSSPMPAESMAIERWGDRYVIQWCASDISSLGTFSFDGEPLAYVETVGGNCDAATPLSLAVNDQTLFVANDGSMRNQDLVLQPQSRHI